MRVSNAREPFTAFDPPHIITILLIREALGLLQTWYGEPMGYCKHFTGDWVCDQCRSRVRFLAREAMVLSYHLSVALVKDVNFGDGTGGSGGGSSAGTRPLPWNESASAAARELSAAMKVLDAWSQGEGVKKSAIDRLDRAVAAGWEVVDTPRRVRLVGECPSCGLDVTVEVGAEEWSCTCGAGGKTERLMAGVIRRSGEVLIPVSEAVAVWPQLRGKIGWLGPVEAVPLEAAHWLAENADSVMTSAEVGRMLGVDVKYVKNLVARGKLEPLARGVKPLRFKRSVVKAYVREAREKRC